MSRLSLFFCLLFLGFAHPGFGADPPPPPIAFDLGTLIQSLIRTAEQGDAMLQLNVGTLYQEGTGVPQSTPEAERWYRKAAMQGLSYAMLNLGLMYYNRELPDPDKLQAYIWTKLSAIRFAGRRELPQAEAFLKAVAQRMSEEDVQRADEQATQINSTIPQYVEK